MINLINASACTNPPSNIYQFERRFDTHCKFHRMDDERQRKRRQELARIKEFRGQIEDVFIDRLRIARVLDPQGSALQLEEKGDPEYPLLLETTPAEDFESGDGERDVRDEAVVQGEEEQAQVKSRSKDDIDVRKNYTT